VVVQSNDRGDLPTGKPRLDGQELEHQVLDEGGLDAGGLEGLRLPRLKARRRRRADDGAIEDPDSTRRVARPDIDAGDGRWNRVVDGVEAVLWQVRGDLWVGVFLQGRIRVRRPWIVWTRAVRRLSSSGSISTLLAFELLLVLAQALADIASAAHILVPLPQG